MGETASGAAQILQDKYEVAELPPDQQRLLDPALPIPPEARFFPEAHSWQSVILNLIGGAISFLVGLCSIGGVILTFRDAGDRNGSSSFACFFGAVVVGFGVGIVFLLNARNRARAIRNQARGETARIGLFLSPNGLLQREPFTYRYFPRERLLGVRLDGTAPMVVFRNNSGDEQALTLPQNLVGMTTAETVRVVEGWLRGSGV
jgi:hypothetical protein